MPLVGLITNTPPSCLSRSHVNYRWCDTCQCGDLQRVSLNAALSVCRSLTGCARVPQHVLAQRVFDAVFAVHGLVQLLLWIDEYSTREGIFFQKFSCHFRRAIAYCYESNTTAVDVSEKFKKTHRIDHCTISLTILSCL
jgi:hypothetical protein